jgi:type IV pilus assembly protein PilY1
MEGELPSVTRQIARMNDGRWALVMGNGYDSALQRPVLLIQYLDGHKELIKLVAGSTSGDGNGLSPPRLVDFNGDNVPDVAYAGDLHGNMWKFDLSDRSPSRWHVAFDGAPLFTATDGATPASAQPITSAPVWAAHPDGGLMLAFGTGRHLTKADRADTSRQSVYGIYDNTQITRPPGSGSVSMTEKRPVSGRGELVEQAMIASPTQPVGTVSSTPVPYSGAGARRGWFIDLPFAGQRILRNLNWFDGDLIDVESTVPAKGGDTEVDTCVPPTASGKGYRTTIDILQGNPPKSRIYASLPSLASGPVATIEVGLNAPLSSGKQQIAVPPTGMPPPPARDYLGRFVKRAAWRQMQ